MSVTVRIIRHPFIGVECQHGIIAGRIHPMSDADKAVNFLEGVNAFQSARLRAFWDEVFSLVRGKPAELLSFEDVRARLRLREEYYKGTMDVPLEHIVGSVGRFRDFTAKFLPKSNKMQDRWSRVYAQANGMMGLPPIELYKVGDVYFVRDGNHRVSVARQMGSRTIQAHVTELPTSISLQPGMSADELAAAAAYAEFLDITGLAQTRPHHQSITLSEPSRYDDLLGHVYLHGAVMQTTEGRAVSLREAASNWYDNVYRPAVTLIRKYKVLQHAPGRTEGDLYLWMIDHLRDAKEEVGDEAKARSFSDALADYLASRRISVPKDLLFEKDPKIALVDPEWDDDREAYIAQHAAEEVFNAPPEVRDMASGED